MRGVVSAAKADNGAHFYCCRSTPVLAAFEQAYAGLRAEQVHVEYFGPRGRPRRSAGGGHRTISDGVYGENQAVTSRDTILRMMTINNAKLTDEAAIKGSIEPGKLADFVVLSADYMTIPEKQVHDLMPVATYVGGRLV